MEPLPENVSQMCAHLAELHPDRRLEVEQVWFVRAYDDEGKRVDARLVHP
jgi:hypothetical protein